MTKPSEENAFINGPTEAEIEASKFMNDPLTVKARQLAHNYLHEKWELDHDEICEEYQMEVDMFVAGYKAAHAEHDRRHWLYTFAGQIMASRIEAGTIADCIARVSDYEWEGSAKEERAKWAVEEASALLSALELRGEGR